MTSTHPLDWIHKIDHALSELDEKPQFGNLPEFDWERFEKNLQKLFNQPHLKVTYQAKGWLASHHMLDGLAEECMPLPISWNPLHATSFFITETAHLKALIIELFGTEEGAQYFFDASLVDGFYHYFASEILRQLVKIRFSAPLTPLIGLPVEDLRKAIGKESCFVIDVSLTINDQDFSGRILLPSSFRREWKTYFSHLPTPSLSEKMKEKLILEIGLEVAHSRLSLSDWKKVKGGDCIVLDRCSYDPIQHKGGVILSLNQKPLFRGRIKDGEIKITNYPLYEETNDIMREKPFNRDLGDEEGDNLYGDLGDNETEFDDEDDLFSGLEEKPFEGEQEEKKSVAPEPLGLDEKPISLVAEEITINLTVEVGRLRMAVSELMKLAPGNLLELNVTPEQGVDLVVNGKKVGRGELVRMGDLLGVRILDL